MQTEDEELDNLNILKQIGKGSFSNVYLCQSSHMSSLHMDDIPVYYIIKEININTLVKKYLSNNTKKRIDHIQKQHEVSEKHQTDNTWEVNITPYKQGNHKIALKSEDEYYYKRLRELVESEVEALLLLEHKNIIKLYGCKYSRGVFYLSMEYCDMGDIYQMLKADIVFEKRYITEFLMQTSVALEYLHTKNLIHRDLKLQNMLVQKVGDDIVFKISDFGFACYDLSAENMMEFWESGEILAKKYFKLCGTPFYMAPEIVMNMRLLENFTKYDEGQELQTSKDKVRDKVFYSKAIDVWSYGVCVYELVCNELPFPKIRSIIELEDFFRKNDAQEFIDKRIDNQKRLNPCLKQLLAMMLKIDHRNRATMAQIVALVKEIANKVFVNDKHDKITNPLRDDRLRKHIVDAPPSNMMSTVVLSDSWEQVGKSDSLVMNVSVEKGFLKWLLNKK